MSISKYLSSNFTSSFLTIFLPLFFIGALVFIIKISALTASIQITFGEMIQLFSYNLPTILFYTLPVSFTVAVVMTLIRLSNDNELMALFALGKKSKSLMNHFLFIAFLFTTVLLILSLGLMPKTKQQFKAFKHQKSSEAQANITPSKLGQKFGNLFVYVKSKDESALHDIVIYNKDKTHNDQLFMAKSANIKNENAVVTLTLNDGSGYTFDANSLKEINYEKMQVFQNLNTKEYTYHNIYDYWKKLSLDSDDRRKILFFIFISFIPLIALYIIAAFSIINPRYQKNYAYQILGVTTIGLYSIATLLKSQGNYMALIVAIVLTSILGLFLFRQNVQRYF